MSSFFKVDIGLKLFFSTLYLIILSGIILRFWGLGQSSYWIDELYTVVHYVQNSWQQTWEITYDDVHPPLYLFAIKSWGLIFGS